MTMSGVRLSATQQQAVTAPWKRRIYMVLSTAGSGKTLVLSLRAVRIAKQILDENRYANKRILCVCFNQAMADEMHSRMSLLVHEQQLSGDVAVTRTGQSVSRGVTIEVRTFHGLGRFLLNCANPVERDRVGVPHGYLNVLHGRQLAKMYFDALKCTGVLKAEATEKSSKHKVYQLMSFFEDFKGKMFDKVCERYILKSATASASTSTSAPSSTTRSSSSSMSSLDSKGKFNLDDHIMKEYRREYEVYQKLLYDNGVIDYGDMIIKSVRLLLLSEELTNFVKRRYASVLVDEFQDVSASQLLMCQAAIEDSQSITFVGDDDQQIYSWRTSSGWFCHQVIQHVFPSLKTLTLPENRRCQGHIVSAAYALIMNNIGRYPKRIDAVKDPLAPVQVIGCNTVDLEKKAVLAHVSRLLNSMDYSSSSFGQQAKILVLFRVNDLLLQFQEVLNDAGFHTSRKLNPDNKAKTPVIGSVTLSTLALVTLIAPDVDVDTFVWAVTTLVSGIEQHMVHTILAKREREDGIQSSKQQASKSSTNTPPARKKRHPFSSSRTPTPMGKSSGGGPVSSVYLDRLRRYISSKQSTVVSRQDKNYDKDNDKAKDDDGEEGIVTSLYDIVKLCDDMQLELRACSTVQQVVEYAMNVVSESEDIGSQGSFDEAAGYSEKRSKNERKREYGGSDVLTNAARKVDTRSRQRERRDRERNPRKRVRIEKVSDILKKKKKQQQKRRSSTTTTASNGRMDTYDGVGDDDGENDVVGNSVRKSKNEEDDDLEDFAELFSSDMKETKRQKRKALGIKDEKGHDVDDDLLVHRYITFLGDDLTEFCNIVRRSLGDYTSGILNQQRKKKRAVDNNSIAETVVMSTIHNAKGATFDHVIVCGINKYNFPNGQVVSGIGNMAGNAQTETDPTGMYCQEERRVFFVAVTRAVKTLTCTYASETPARNKPKEHESMFIKEMMRMIQQQRGKNNIDITNATMPPTTPVEETFIINDSDLARL